MSLSWIRERNAVWNADKARIVGRAAPGIFDTRYGNLAEGHLVPAEWWRVEDDGRTVGYGWLDVNWGDAEILLATDAEARGRGVGTFVLRQLELEARARGLNYMYNIVRPTHPEGDRVTAWLVARGFGAAHDGRLLRAVPYEPA
ncbi:MAG: GNAT family N-acetyltransferase [Sandaracinaceae bacterium]|nr:GNAT family N-acetyltransferase [Sandaracinaceae bacterium]